MILTRRGGGVNCWSTTINLSMCPLKIISETWIHLIFSEFALFKRNYFRCYEYFIWHSGADTGFFQKGARIRRMWEKKSGFWWIRAWKNFLGVHGAPLESAPVDTCPWPFWFTYSTKIPRGKIIMFFMSSIGRYASLYLRCRKSQGNQARRAYIYISYLYSISRGGVNNILYNRLDSLSRIL